MKRYEASIRKNHHVACTRDRLYILRSGLPFASLGAVPATRRTSLLRASQKNAIASPTKIANHSANQPRGITTRSIVAFDGTGYWSSSPTLTAVGRGSHLG